MVIGIPREIKQEEYRVSLTPSGATELTLAGHTVFVETSAGAGSGFSDNEYIKAGARITDKKTLFDSSELIIKVKEPLPEEYAFFKESQALFTFLHLAPNRGLLNFLLDRKITSFAYETLEDNGKLPLLAPMSEVAGRMSPIIASYYLQKHKGGAGILPTGVPGVLPAKAIILGAGVVGTNAAWVSFALGMRVTVISSGIERLRAIDEIFKGAVSTQSSIKHNIVIALEEADIVIGAALVPGAHAPKLVSRDMVSEMKKGSVIVDVSIDQGGCIETSRPTTHENPIYEEYGVVHYCVDNMPAAYPRTSTIALTNSTRPYIKGLADAGIDKAIKEFSSFKSALNTYNGAIANKALAGSLGLPVSD